MGVYYGNAEMQFGGELGICFELDIDGVAIIPARVAHKRLTASDDFTVFDTYSKGSAHTLNIVPLNERSEAEEDITKVEKPDNDHFYGNNTYLFECWHNKNCKNV